MKRWKEFFWILIACSVLATLAWTATGVGAEQEPVSKPETVDSGERSTLDGGKVFAWYCGSCHAERYPKEHTDAEWDVIVAHMRVRANLTGEQARAVLHYLQENNE